jgi:PKD repeat protein
MKKILISVIVIITSICLSVNYLVSNSNHTNLGTGFTDAPSEGNCTTCHGGSILNNGSGAVAINYNAGNNFFSPSTVYNITVTLTHPSVGKGFMLTALDAANMPAGTFTAGVGSNTSIHNVGGNNRNYIGHSAVSFTGVWTFQWTSPAAATGNITFYVAGNAVDQNFTTTNDQVYTSSLIIAPNPVLPIANFSTPSDTICAGSTTIFTDLSSANGGLPLVGYAWDFGDGSSQIIGISPIPATISHVYTTNGTYTVSYLVSTYAGLPPAPPNAYDTITKSITVITCSPLFTSIVALNSGLACQNSPGMYLSVDTGGLAPYINIWDMGDGSPLQTTDTITYSYTTPGNYIISLTTIDAFGDTATAFFNPVVVTAAINANAGPDQTICNGNSVQIGMAHIYGNFYNWIPTTNLSNTTASNPIANPATTTTYYLTVLDSATAICFSTDSMVVTVNPCLGPIANFTFGPNDTVCAGSNIIFTDLSNPNGSTLQAYGWDFGDGSPMVIGGPPIPGSVSHTYLTTGTYQVSYYITSSFINPFPPNTADTFFKTIVVEPCGIVVSIISPLPSQNTICVGANLPIQSTTLFNTGATTTVTDFGDGSPTASGASVAHVYTTPGIYVLSVFATDALPSADTAYMSINVLPLPLVDAGNDTIICQGSGSSAFIGNALLPATANYSWSPATGLATPNSSSSVALPASTTTYTLTANNGACTSTDQVIVSVAPAPVVAISVNPTTVCAGSPVTIVSSIITGGPIATYTWNLGGATLISGSLTGPGPLTVSWPSTGPKIVGLSVISIAGCFANANPITVIVNSCGNVPPIASFTNNAGTLPCTGQAVTFTDLSVNTPTSWSWNFGGGATPITSNLQNPIVAFNIPGIHTITLTASNASGSGSVTSSISILATPSSTFTATSAICVGNTATVIYTGGAPAGSSFNWLWGGAIASPGVGPGPHTAVFNSPGFQSLSLTVTNGNCASTTNANVQVNSLPTASFTHVTNTDTVVFTNNSFGASTYLWQISDGSNYTTTNPIHIFALNGSYQICLTAFNGQCNSNFCDSVHIVLLDPNSVDPINTNIGNAYFDPQNQQLVVEWNEAANTNKIEVYSATGQLVTTSTNYCNTCYLNTQNLTSGLYILKAISNKKTIVKKWVKQ